MKKIVKNGKIVLVPRGIEHITVYEVDGKTVSSQFNYEDWSDILKGFNRKTVDIKIKKRLSLDPYRLLQTVMENDIIKLSDDRLLRVTCLALRALVPSQITFLLLYFMIYKEDYIPNKATVKNLEELFAGADSEMIKIWFREINTFVIPLLEKAFDQLYRRNRKPIFGGFDYQLPSILTALVDELKKEAIQLPIYQVDFKGVIVNGEIYHEPRPTHLPPMFYEVNWRGGHHVDSTEISASQIQRQGGSFGPLCLFYLRMLTRFADCSKNKV